MFRAEIRKTIPLLLFSTLVLHACFAEHPPESDSLEEDDDGIVLGSGGENGLSGRKCGECSSEEVCCTGEHRCSGDCVPDCVTTGVCPDSLVCDEQLHFCVEGMGGASAENCSASSPCDDGFVCCPEGRGCAGTCVMDCRETGMCRNGLSCDAATGTCN